jgi:hypothetical protein
MYYRCVPRFSLKIWYWWASSLIVKWSCVILVSHATSVRDILGTPDYVGKLIWILQNNYDSKYFSGWNTWFSKYSKHFFYTLTILESGCTLWAVLKEQDTLLDCLALVRSLLLRSRDGTVVSIKWSVEVNLTVIKITNLCSHNGIALYPIFYILELLLSPQKIN